MNTKDEIIKVVVNENYIQKEVEGFVSDIETHILEHLKLLIEESLKFTLPHSERQKLVGIFLEAFANRVNKMFTQVGKRGVEYVESRTTAAAFDLVAPSLAEYEDEFDVKAS